MNRRQVTALICVVVAAHAFLFWLVANTNPLPKTTFVAPPNFIAKEGSWTDKETGERFTVHEYQVSTRLAMPDALMVKKQ